MSVQRWDVAAGLFTQHPTGGYVTYADHARIVAEATAEARAAERRHWEARFRNAEQAHAAALAEAECPDPTICEREDCVTAAAYRAGGEDAIAEYARNMPRAAAPRILTRDGWWPFGSFVDYDFPLEFDGEGEDGLPIWERPDKSRLAPRILTADDPEPAVGSVVLDRDQSVWQRVGSTEHSRWVNPFMGTREWPDVLARGPVRLIHDGEATPQVKPCSTCGEPVAYLTARPGWAGGWLHHPARPLDGHPAAIDGEATT